MAVSQYHRAGKSDLQKLLLRMHPLTDLKEDIGI